MINLIILLLILEVFKFFFLDIFYKYYKLSKILFKKNLKFILSNLYFILLLSKIDYIMKKIKLQKIYIYDL